MIPDFQTLMRPVLELAAKGEISISDASEILADEFDLSVPEREELLPSGRQGKFRNRLGWARTYLKQAGLITYPKRGWFVITKDGKAALPDAPERIDMSYLEQFPSYLEFRGRTREATTETELAKDPTELGVTPDEVLRMAHEQITAALAADLLDRLRSSEPAFFEDVIVRLLLRMGYGYGPQSGSVVGQTGDDGVDGVINLDRLGVDQVYIQAKRYSSSNTIGSGAIRDFYGALGLKDVTKGIFVTTSSFSPSAKTTAEKLGARIVLIDGFELTRLMIANEIGCRTVETYKVMDLEGSFFE